MSGLYNIVMGCNKATPHIMVMLGIESVDRLKKLFPRFRDTWVDDEGTSILILTRDYEATQAGREHPCFIEWNSCDGDTTYSYYRFSVPPHFRAIAQEVAKVTDRMPPFERYLQVIEDLKNNVENPATERAKAVGQQIAEAMFGEGATKQQQSVSNKDGEIVIERYGDAEQYKDQDNTSRDGEIPREN